MSDICVDISPAADGLINLIVLFFRFLSNSSSYIVTGLQYIESAAVMLFASDDLLVMKLLVKLSVP